MVSILRNNFRLTVGKSCGFHIHVSKGTGPMLLHLVRKVSVLMYLAENIVYRLCCPGRRKSRYAPSLASLLEPLCTDQWSEMDVPADFEQYIPVHKVVDRRTLGILKKLWTTETLQLLKLLITPSMGSKSCLGLSKCHSFDEFGEGSEDECKGTVEFRYLEGTLDPELILRWSQLMVSLFQFADLASPQAWQNFVPAVLQCPALGRMDPNVLRVFLLFLGKGDDYDFWNNRMQMMTNFPLDAQQQARRPVDNNVRINSRFGISCGLSSFGWGGVLRRIPRHSKLESASAPVFRSSPLNGFFIGCHRHGGHILRTTVG